MIVVDHSFQLSYLLHKILSLLHHSPSTFLSTTLHSTSKKWTNRFTANVNQSWIDRRLINYPSLSYFLYCMKWSFCTNLHLLLTEGEVGCSTSKGRATHSAPSAFTPRYDGRHGARDVSGRQKFYRNQTIYSWPPFNWP